MFKRIAPGEFRNQKCPCGSGLKYKKCHYLIDSELNAGIRDGYIQAHQEYIKNLKKDDSSTDTPVHS